MQSPPLDLKYMLTVLVERDVRFIVVGGVSAVLQGAPVSTFDMDIVHERSEENLARLLGALKHLEARFRTNTAIAPDLSHIQGPGHALLLTSAGALDVLGSLGKQGDYSDLKSHAVTFSAHNLEFDVLDLATLIRCKEESDREKDRAVLPILRSTLARLQELEP